MKRGSDFLAYSLIDALVDNVLPTIDRMADLTQAVEEQALGKPRPHTPETILQLKRSSRRIHRTMVPQRELLNRLSRGEYAVVKRDSLVYFRDIYDHLVRIEDLNTSVHEGADNALSIYLTAVANRQNETMRVLAIAGAIFLPLTLLAGIYGMNFDNMPELHWRYGYFGVLAFMGTVIAVALIVFWRRQWFSLRPTRRRVARLFSVEQRKLRGYRPPSAPPAQSSEKGHGGQRPPGTGPRRA
jgi:magnesium transporter